MTNPDQYESPPPTTPEQIADEIRRLLGRVAAMSIEMCAKPAPLSPAGFRDYLAKYHAMVGRLLDQLLATSKQEDIEPGLALIVDLPMDWEAQLETAVAEGITTAHGPKEKVNYLLMTAAAVQKVDDHFRFMSMQSFQRLQPRNSN